MYPLKYSLITLSLCSALLSAQTHAAGIQIINTDGAGEGFNDATVVSTIGGNSATTLGAQRLAVFNRAADILNATFDIAVTVNVNSSFDPLFCDTNSATLGSAGAADYEFIHNGSEWTVYADALANQLQGSDVTPAVAEINAQFNSGIGNPGCLQSSGWYLGFDDPAGSGNSLLSVVLHEIMHGMGFFSLLASDGSSGATVGGSFVYDPYTKLLYDASQGARVTTLNQTQRAASTTNNGNLVWDGAQTNAQLGGFSAGVNSGRMQMYAPTGYTPGSSVSHFDTAATPNEIMEPQYTEFLDDAGLAKYLLADIGWTLASAGNSAPVMGAVSAQTLNEDATLDVTVVATDADGDSLTYTITAATAELGASISGTTLSITPQANYNGTGSITVQVSDGVLTDSTSFNVTIDPVNDAPVFTSASSFNTANDADLIITLTASDIDTAGGSLVFSLVNVDSAKLSGSLSGSTLTLTPVAGTSGTTTVDVAVSDGVISTPQSISVNVLSAANQAPVFNPPTPLTLLQETSTVVTLSASDADGNSLTYSVGSVGSGVSAAVSGDQLSISADTGFTGNASISLSVSDGVLNDSAILAVTVLPKFELQQDGITLGNGDSLNAALNALPLTLSGGDGQLSTSLFFDGSQQDSLLSYNATTQSYSLAMPSSGAFAGTYTLSVTDGHGFSATYYIERPLRVTTNVTPTLALSASQTISVEGAPAGSLLSLSSSSAQVAFNDASGNALTTTSAPDDADHFNAARVVLTFNAVSHNSQPVITASATNLPDGELPLALQAGRTVLITVTDQDSQAVTGAIAALNDNRFEQWGLPSSASANSSGEISLQLPEESLQLNLSAEGYLGTTLTIDDAQLSAEVTLTALDSPFSLNGIVQASGFDFSTELPQLTLLFSDNSSEVLTLNSISSTSASYNWLGDLAVKTPQSLQIRHSNISQITASINTNFSSQTINVTLVASAPQPTTEVIVVSSGGSSGGGALWYLLWLCPIIAMNRFIRANIRSRSLSPAK